MINLFHLDNFNIDTSIFNNLLHDEIVTEFEESFASLSPKSERDGYEYNNK